MRFSVDALIFESIPALPTRLQRRPILRLFWRIFYLLLGVICYLGVVMSAFMVEAIVPYHAMRWGRKTDSPTFIWVVALISLTGIAFLCLVALVATYRFMRLRHLNVDYVALFVGSVLAFAWTLLNLIAGP